MGITSLPPPSRMMRPLGFLVLMLSTLLVHGSEQLKVCHKQIADECSQGRTVESSIRCTSRQKGFNDTNTKLQQMIKVDFEDSITYLIMGSYYDTDAKNHLGFHKYFMAKSDKMWARGKDLMKYVLKRGEKVDNLQVAAKGVTTNTEIQNLAKSMDLLKQRATEVREAYTTALGESEHSVIDPATLHVLEELSEAYSDEVKETSAKLNTMRRLLIDERTITGHLALQLFDKHLQA